MERQQVHVNCILAHTILNVGVWTHHIVTKNVSKVLIYSRMQNKGKIKHYSHPKTNNKFNAIMSSIKSRETNL